MMRSLVLGQTGEKLLERACELRTAPTPFHEKRPKVHNLRAQQPHAGNRPYVEQEAAI